MSHRRVDGREDDMVKSIAIASYGDEPMRREGLQARVRDKISLTTYYSTAYKSSFIKSKSVIPLSSTRAFRIFLIIY